MERREKKKSLRRPQKEKEGKKGAVSQSSRKKERPKITEKC
jgi:hypothetical protein